VRAQISANCTPPACCFSSRRRKVAGAPRSWLVMGEGLGGPFCSAARKTSSSDPLAAQEARPSFLDGPEDRLAEISVLRVHDPVHRSAMHAKRLRVSHERLKGAPRVGLWLPPISYLSAPRGLESKLPPVQNPDARTDLTATPVTLIAARRYSAGPPGALVLV
jgi:hypothetical protein